MKGKATYFPFLTVNGHEQDFRNTVAHPGDMVTLEAVANQGPHGTTVSVFDSTHSFSKTKNGTGYSNYAGHPWAGDVTWSNQSNVLGVPDFGKIHFRTVTINGSPFATFSPQQRFRPLQQEQDHAPNPDRSVRSQQAGVRDDVQALVSR